MFKELKKISLGKIIYLFGICFLLIVLVNQGIPFIIKIISVIIASIVICVGILLESDYIREMMEQENLESSWN